MNGRWHMADPEQLLQLQDHNYEYQLRLLELKIAYFNYDKRLSGEPKVAHRFEYY